MLAARMAYVWSGNIYVIRQAAKLKPLPNIPHTWYAEQCCDIALTKNGQRDNLQKKYLVQTVYQRTCNTSIVDLA